MVYIDIRDGQADQLESNTNNSKTTTINIIIIVCNPVIYWSRIRMDPHTHGPYAQQLKANLCIGPSGNRPSFRERPQTI